MSQHPAPCSTHTQVSPCPGSLRGPLPTSSLCQAVAELPHASGPQHLRHSRGSARRGCGSRATLKAWAEDGEVAGVAQSLGARELAVEVEPLLPKGCLEESEGCGQLWEASSSVLACPQGPTPCRLSPREGRDGHEPDLLTSSLASR